MYNVLNGFFKIFLGKAPVWYKLTIVLFLIINPFIYYFVSNFWSGWLLVLEFIFTLSMALKCYPLPSGGLLALEAVIIGMTDAKFVYHEVLNNVPVILLLIFMVAGIYFMKESLLFLFSRVLVKVKSKISISLIFLIFSAFLSAFLDALTVTAVIMSVAYGFYSVYHKVVSESPVDEKVRLQLKDELGEFRGFLRNIIMHGAVGTALGGAATLVGEPQNLLIGHKAGWDFVEFFIECSKVSIPVIFIGILTCIILERFRIMGYGYKMPENVRTVLSNYMEKNEEKMDLKMKIKLIAQGAVGILLIVALAFHVAEVGLIGLMVIVLLTAFNGITDEHEIGNAFREALPFTALLVIFFVIVAVIDKNRLFKPVIDYVFSLSGKTQMIGYFVANGILSAISDNVFVATVYINETANHFKDILPFLGRDFSALPVEVVDKIHHFWKLAVSINMGTNIPSVATPNGQAAFLFLLTSGIAPLIRLSYLEMVKLAFPYTITMTTTGLLATAYLL